MNIGNQQNLQVKTSKTWRRFSFNDFSSFSAVVGELRTWHRGEEQAAIPPNIVVPYAFDKDAKSNGCIVMQREQYSVIGITTEETYNTSYRPLQQYNYPDEPVVITAGKIGEAMAKVVNMQGQPTLKTQDLVIFIYLTAESARSDVFHKAMKKLIRTDYSTTDTPLHAALLSMARSYEKVCQNANPTVVMQAGDARNRPLVAEDYRNYITHLKQQQNGTPLIEQLQTVLTFTENEP
jgi:hypothetical protein